MKLFFVFIIFALLISCQQEEEALPQITSKVDCIVPVYSIIPENGFKNEDSITVTAIVQLR